MSLGSPPDSATEASTSKITAAQIEEILSRLVTSKSAQPGIQALASFLASIINGAIPSQEASNFVENTPSLRALIKELASKQVPVKNGVISFGSDNNIGDIHISGDIAGGSIIKLTIFAPEPPPPFFSEINLSELKRFAFPNFVEPSITERCLEILNTHHVLVLQGDRLLNEAELARFIALKFAQSKATTSVKPMRVLNWTRTSQLRDVDILLEQQEDVGIFVLAQITPALNGANFFYNLTGTRHFVIITTDVANLRWNLQNVTNSYWLDLSELDLYLSEDLIRKLLHDLKSSNASTSWKKFIRWDFADNPSTICGYPLQDLVQKLQTPQRCELFVRFVTAEFKKSDSEFPTLLNERLLVLISMVNDLKQRLDRWYFHSLTTREQFMVIGLSCFSDVYDNQFFAALDRVIRQAWRKLEPSLSYTDYHDLSNLTGTFFQWYETRTDSPLIENYDSDQRRRLFVLLWKTHRRRITSALPTLVQLAIESTRNHAPIISRDLYSDEERREKLRRTISETLSDVGMISQRDTRELLFQLATDSNLGSQAVSAKAVARWQSYKEYIAPMYETLEEWLAISTNSPLDKRNYLLSTVLLATSYILETFTDGSELPDQLLDILKKIVTQASPRLRYQIRQYVVPKIHHKHLAVAEDLLFNLGCYEDTHDVISNKLAEMYSTGSSRDVVDILYTWSNRVPIEITTSNEINIISQTVIQLVARTSSSLLFQGPAEEQNRILQLLKIVISRYNSELVRNNILLSFRANSTQDVSQLNQVNQVLHLYISYATTEELDKLAQTLATLSIIYSNTLNNSPILTNELLHFWLSDVTSISTQRIAFRSFMYISEKLAPISRSAQKHKKRRFGKSGMNWFRGVFAIYIGTIRRYAMHRRAVQNLLPQALVEFDADPHKYEATVNYILTRSHQASYRIINALDNVVYIIKYERLIKANFYLFLLVIALSVLLIYTMTT